MLRIAVVEDEEVQAERIKAGIDRFFSAEGADYSVTRYSDGLDFISKYKRPYDIVLMDIEMPHLSGIETARELRKIDETAVLIFATRMGQFAIHGYEVNAIGYMLKPVTDFALRMNLTKAVNILAARTDEKIVLTTKSGIVTLSSKRVEYVEVSGHKLMYHTKSETHEVYGKLSEEEEKLRGCNFSRCSNAFLVNLAKVTAIIGNTVRLSSGAELSISRSMKKQFLDDYIAYVGR